MVDGPSQIGQYALVRAADLRMRTRRTAPVCASVAFLLAVLASGCGSDTSPEEGGGGSSVTPSTSDPSTSMTTSTSAVESSEPSIASTDAVATSTSTPVKPPAATVAPPPKEPAEIAPTTVRSDPVNLVPPADPSRLIGAIISAAEVEPSRPPPPRACCHRS